MVIFAGNSEMMGMVTPVLLQSDDLSRLDLTGGVAPAGGRRVIGGIFEP
jgi:hypothetical protein